MMAARQVPSLTGGLGSIVRRGVAIAASGVVIVQVVTILQTLVLGRLLGPGEVGVYAAGSILMGFVMIVSEGTLSQALIQREDDLEDAANTALVVTVLTGLLLSLAALALSPAIGMLFHSERVGLIAAASSGLMLLHSFSIVPDAMMQRAFQFSRRIIIGPVMTTTFAVVAIAFALLGYGAWAMVIGSYASMTIWVAMSWLLTKWRPFRGRFSFRIWREMAKFSWPIAVEGLAERVREAVEQAVVGRMLGTASLGQYRYAFRIGSLPAGAIIQSCSFVLFPAFSRISGDPDRLRQAFLRALGWLWLAALPVAALMVLTGEPVVVLLLGAEWQPAGVATEAMAGMGLGLALCSVAVEASKSAGKSSLLLWLAAIQLGIGLPLVFALLHYGLVGVGIAVSITHILLGIASVVGARPVIGVSFREIGRCLAPSTVSAIVALGAAIPLKQFLFRSESLALLPGLASVIAVCLAYGAVYLGALRILAPSRFRAIHQFIGRTIAAKLGRRQSEVVVP